LGLGVSTGLAASPKPLSSSRQEIDMTWTTPTLVEVNVGMEVTSYASAKR
jgi:coenzyme PQQ precursor peptide PqqA